ncbi:hypothetical protein, partial [Salmonella sp. s51228]|uniref:hypothetical protein n=1 Tax=Salmonella sp. s51228 TaxID=3159652 RepID=UPI0039814829
DENEKTFPLKLKKSTHSKKLMRESRESKKLQNQSFLNVNCSFKQVSEYKNFFKLTGESTEDKNLNSQQKNYCEICRVPEFTVFPDLKKQRFSAEIYDRNIVNSLEFSSLSNISNFV